MFVVESVRVVYMCVIGRPDCTWLKILTRHLGHFCSYGFYTCDVGILVYAKYVWNVLKLFKIR